MTIGDPPNSEEGYSVSDNSISTLLPEVNSLQNAELVIYGRLVIDKDFTIDASTIYMMPGAAIHVGTENQEVNFKISNTTIEGCEKLWRGILVEGTSQFTLQSSSLRDAVRGVYASTTVEEEEEEEEEIKYPLLIIEDVLFERNHAGIYLTGGVDSNSRIVGCTFDGTETSLKEAYYQETGNEEEGVAFPIPFVGFPYSFKSIYGVVIHEVVSSEEGGSFSIGEDNTQNVFKRLAYGVFSNKTPLRVTNSKFEDIQPQLYYTPSNGLVDIGGHGIYHKEAFLEQTGFGKEGELSFNNVFRPIYLYKSAYQIKGNNIWNANIGITAFFDDSESTANNMIDHNTIHTFGEEYSAGIIMAFNQQATDITGNKLDIISDKGATGIYSSNYTMPTNGLQIKGNEIRMRTNALTGSPTAVEDAKKYLLSGIYLLNNSTARGGETDPGKITVQDNEIDLDMYLKRSFPGIGIYVSNCEDVVVNEQNSIIGKGTNLFGFWETESYNTYGIRAVNSPACTFECNKIDETKVGILIEGGCESTDNLRGNNFGTHGAGLWLDNGGVIGGQKHQGNIWKTNGANQVVSQQGKYYPGGAARHWGSSLDDWDESEFLVNDAIIGHNPDEAVRPTDAINNWFKKQEGNTFSCTEKINENPISRRGRYRYNALKPNGTYWNLANPSNSIGYNLSPAGQWNLNRQIYATIQEEHPNGAPDSRLSNFVTIHNSTSVGQFYQVEQEIRQLMAMDVDNRVSQIAAVRGSNSSIAASAPYEQYEKVVNDIFLQTLAVENLEFSESQKTDLFGMASLCSYEAGTAVFKARALYIFINPSVQFNDVCNSNAVHKKESIDIISRISVQIFPNPAKQSFTIRNVEKVKVQITSIVGKQVYNRQLNQGDTQINTQKWMNGLYIVRIESVDGTVSTQKIVVNH